MDDVTGLLFANLTDRAIRFHGSHEKVQEGLQKLSYAPAPGSFQKKDVVKVSCLWTRRETMHRPHQRQSDAEKEIFIELSDPPLWIKSEHSSWKMKEDGLLRFDNFSITDPVSIANEPNAPMLTSVNFTVVASSFGKVSFMEHPFDVKISVVKTIAELNQMFVLSPVLFRPQADFSSDLCGKFVEVEFSVFAMEDPQRSEIFTAWVEVESEPDLLILKVPEVEDRKFRPNHGGERLENDLVEPDFVLEVREAATVPSIELIDHDHCCLSGGQNVNDETLAIVFHVPFVKVGIYPSPYIDELAMQKCYWNTIDFNNKRKDYPVMSGGWVSSFDLKYSQHARRPQWKTISNLRGPAHDPLWGNAGEHIINYVHAPNVDDHFVSSSNMDGIFAQRLQFHVKEFMGFPGFRFEVYGCADEDLYVGGVSFTQLDLGTNASYDVYDVDGVTKLWNASDVNGTRAHVTCDGGSPHDLKNAGTGFDAGVSTFEECEARCTGQCGAFTFFPPSSGQAVKCWVYMADCQSEELTENFAADKPITFRRNLPSRNACGGDFIQPLVFNKIGQPVVKSLKASSTLFHYDGRVRGETAKNEHPATARFQNSEQRLAADRIFQKNLHKYFAPQYASVNSTTGGWVPHFLGDYEPHIDVVFLLKRLS